MPLTANQDSAIWNAANWAGLLTLVRFGEGADVDATAQSVHDWGSQVVLVNAPLTGDGTSGNGWGWLLMRRRCR
jgi:hypothetical protein